MRKKHLKNCTASNYVGQSFILVSAINGCFSFSGFGSLVGIPIGITSSSVLKVLLK